MLNCIAFSLLTTQEWMLITTLWLWQVRCFKPCFLMISLHVSESVFCQKLEHHRVVWGCSNRRNSRSALSGKPMRSNSFFSEPLNKPFVEQGFPFAFGSKKKKRRSWDCGLLPWLCFWREELSRGLWGALRGKWNSKYCVCLCLCVWIFHTATNWSMNCV